MVDLFDLTRNLSESNMKEPGHFAQNVKVQSNELLSAVPQVQFAQTRCAKYSLLFNKWRQFDEHALDEFRIKVMLLTKIETGWQNLAAFRREQKWQ